VQLIARTCQERGEGAGAAAEIGHAGAGREPSQLDERADQGLGLRRKHTVFVGGGMAVEERDLFMLVLLHAAVDSSAPNPRCDRRPPGHRWWRHTSSASASSSKKAYIIRGKHDPNHGYGNKPDGHYRGDENPGPYLPTKVGLVDRNNGQHHNDDLAL
jgi:hypothetical protein